MSQALSDARQVLTNPSLEATPLCRLLAWSILKTARGQTVHMLRLQKMQRGAA